MKTKAVFLITFACFMAACAPRGDENHGTIDYDPRFSGGVWKITGGLNGAEQAMRSACVSFGCDVDSSSETGARRLVAHDFELIVLLGDGGYQHFGFKISKDVEPDNVKTESKLLFNKLEEEGLVFTFDENGPPY